MPVFKDITGQRLGRLVVVRLAGRRTFPSGSRFVWLVRCDCGTELELIDSSLKRPRKLAGSHSCGCFLVSAEYRAHHSAKNTRHGHSSAGSKRSPSATYKTWVQVIRRCTDKKFPPFARYGARGITVCDRWRHSFEAFLEDMGERPSGMSIDRKDNARGYELDNCRWATPAQQTQNSSTARITIDLVQEIRGRIEHGESPLSVAARMGLSRGHVQKVRDNKIWKESVDAQSHSLRSAA